LQQQSLLAIINPTEKWANLHCSKKNKAPVKNRSHQPHCHSSPQLGWAPSPY